jgi:hypothetical protein
MRKYSDYEYWSKDFDRFTCSEPSCVWKSVSFCMYTGICALIAPKQLVRFHPYLIFQSLFIISQHPVNTDISAPKLGAPKVGQQKQSGDFSRIALMIFIKMSVIYGDHLLNRTCTRGPNVKYLLCQNQLYRSDRFHCPSIFINHQCPASNNQLLFCGNTVKLNHM